MIKDLFLDDNDEHSTVADMPVDQIKLMTLCSASRVTRVVKLAAFS